MSEKSAQAATELGPVAQLLTHYADGSDVAIAAATKLTLEMITETATWFDGLGDPRAAEKVRQAWIGLVRKGIGGEEAEAFDRRWEATFVKSNAKAVAEARRAELESRNGKAEACGRASGRNQACAKPAPAGIREVTRSSEGTARRERA
jgi:hypothetical protein